MGYDAIVIANSTSSRAEAVREFASRPRRCPLRRADTTTGTENPPSETLPCARQASMSMVAGEVVLQCGSTLIAFG